jgi:hypothetical protein
MVLLHPGETLFGRGAGVELESSLTRLFLIRKEANKTDRFSALLLFGDILFYFFISVEHKVRFKSKLLYYFCDRPHCH